MRVVPRRRAAQCAAPEETVVEYAEGLGELFIKFQPEAVSRKGDDLVVRYYGEKLGDRFLGGLKTSIRRAVMTKQPNSFSEAVNYGSFEVQICAMGGTNSEDLFNHGRGEHFAVMQNQ